MSRVRGQSVADTNHRIVSSALRIFRETGLANAKVGDICANANVSRKTLYEYYEGKYDLFRAVLNVEAEFFIDALTKIERRADPDDILRSVFYLVFDEFGSAFGCLMSEIGINSSVIIPERARQASQICLGLIEEAIVAGSGTGQFRQDVDSQRYLAMMNIIINGFYSSSNAVEQMLNVNLRNEEDIRSWREHLASVLISSLR
jgi:Transcriptional regulator